MKIDCKNEDNILTICMDGELDHHVASIVKDELDRLILDNMPTGVVFDFKGVKFMDSTGIGVLLGRYKMLKSLNIKAYLKNPTNTIDRLLKLSGIYNVIAKI